MRRLNRSCFIVFLAAFSLVGCGDGSDTNYLNDRLVTEAEAAATGMVERHMVARNNWDAEAIAAEDNFPQIRFANGMVTTRNTAEEMIHVEETHVFPWLEAIGWHHSVWDEIKIVQSSANKVHFALVFSRVDASGNAFFTTPTFWVVTKQNNHWGLKLRSSFGDELLYGGGGDIAGAETAAIKVLERRLEARNDRDTDSLAAINGYPLVFLSDVEFNVFETIDEYILHEETVVIPDLDYSQWDHSEWEQLEVIQSTKSTVHIIGKLSHFDVTGKKYLTQDQFWVIRNNSGDWRIHVQSNFVDAIQRR